MESNSLIYHFSQNRKAFQPFGRLERDGQHGLDELRVWIDASAHACLVRKRAARFQTALDSHQAKLASKLIRIVRLQAKTVARRKQKEPALAYLCKRRHRQNTVEQQRDKIVAGRTHARVLVIDDPQAIVLVEHQVERMIVAVTKHARTCRQFGGNIIELGFQLGRFTVSQGLTSQAPEVMFEEKVQLPGKLGLIECQTARN